MIFNKLIKEFGYLVLTVPLCFSTAEQSVLPQQRQQDMLEKIDGKWTTWYNQQIATEKFITRTNPDGFTLTTKRCESGIEDIYVYYYLRLDKPVKDISFEYSVSGNAKLMPITLYDAAANELWRFDGNGKAPAKVNLENIRARGQIVFCIRRNKSVELPDGWSQIITGINLIEDRSNPICDKDGYILVDNLNEFRGYVCEDNVKVRLKPGTYTIDKALFRSFIEVSSSNSGFDLSGVKLLVDTRLFSRFGTGGRDAIYCVFKLSGKHLILEGVNIDTYGNQPGIQSKNKIFNITGTDIILKNAEIRTDGSSPWGYGSLYGISGGDVRKMNGIRVGWPAEDVKLIGCKVHMRAMGHAIFVQGAVNTLIEDCHVDGLLRTTDEILAEKSGYAFDKNFFAGGRGYIEGVMAGSDGKILPGEMISLSEDGIRLYPQGGDSPTLSTTIRNCTVTKMRRGICTGLNSSGDKVINCEVTDCIAAGFNAGNCDTLINCSADAKYAEALCLAYVNAAKAYVEMEILDSRGGMGNNMLVKINGSDHYIIVKTPDLNYIPDGMAVELSTSKGYGGPRGSSNPVSKNIHLTNRTKAVVILNPGTNNPVIESSGLIVDLTK